MIFFKKEEKVEANGGPSPSLKNGMKGMEQCQTPPWHSQGALSFPLSLR